MPKKSSTMVFAVPKEEARGPRDILLEVHAALAEKGYNPVHQIVGYLISGDPAYITSHRNARALVRQMERDEIMEELVSHYLQFRAPAVK